MPRNSAERRALGAAILLLVNLVGGTPRPARAAPVSDELVAQSLFERARALIAAGDYARACPLLEESQRLDPAGGTLLNLATCHEGEGKIATAYVEYGQALVSAVRDQRKDREEIARARIAALGAELPRLVVHKPERGLPEGLVLAIDGKVVTNAVLDVPFPLDPGTHLVDANAPNHDGWRWEGPLARGRTVEVTVVLRERGDAPAMVVVAPANGASTSSSLASSSGGRRREGGFDARPWLLAGSGVLAVSSMVFFGLSIDARASALDACLPERGFCANQAGVDDVGRARTFAWLSIGTVVGAAVAATASLFVKSPSKSSSVGAVPFVVPGGITGAPPATAGTF